jgi:phosphohistidine swiveling domain-containing protein
LKFGFYSLTFDLTTQHADEWINEKLYKAESRRAIDMVKREGIGYFSYLEQEGKEQADVFKTTIRELLPKLSKMDDEELIRQFMLFIDYNTTLYAPGAMAFIYAQQVSEMLAASLGERYSNAADVIGQLLKTGYKSFMIESEEALLRIKESKNAELVEKYLEDFYFMEASYMYVPALTRQRVLEKAKVTLEHFEEPISEEVAVDLTEDEQAIVDILRHTEAIHDQRKRINLIGSYTLSRFLDELVRRTGMERSLVEKMFWFEYPDALRQDERLLAKLAKRTHATVLLDGTNRYYADSILVSEPVVDMTTITELRGTPASKGEVEGVVKIVLQASEFGKIQPGDILVTEMTRPDFVPIMKKSAAILTDEGGLTCHAAILSRELHIPCIVGTKRGTKVLKDGDRVRVDATKGKVTIL